MKEMCSPINAEFNRIIKETDSIYSKYAALHHISTTTMCVLYSISTAETPCTQTGLCEDWDIPRQTINSCLKVLQKEGIVQMMLGEGNRKNKYIQLTALGEKSANQVIAPLVHAENAALQALDPEELRLFMDISRKHNALLQKFLLDLNI